MLGWNDPETAPEWYSFVGGLKMFYRHDAVPPQYEQEKHYYYAGQKSIWFVILVLAIVYLIVTL